MNAKRFQETFLLVAVLVVTLLFFNMIKGFVMTILLAAIFSGLSAPLYGRYLRGFKGRAVPLGKQTTRWLLKGLGFTVS